MTELNGSSYYRANPFYQQGYLPDMAYKNRKLPNYMVEIPQGQQHFEPTNKKHFQRVGYYTTIGQQHLMDPDPDTVSSPSRDRQYFRNLHVEDIQGANTNTLISKAVKNRMKAKQYLIQKQRMAKQQADRQKMNKIMRRQQQQKRLQALSKMNRQKQPNYHEKVMKLRTQQSDNKYSPPPAPKEPYHQRQEPQREHNNNHFKQQYQNHVGNGHPNHNSNNIYTNFHEQQYEKYKRDLLDTQREIQELENQLRESRQKYKGQGYQYQQPSHMPQEENRRVQKYQEVQKNIIPQTYHSPYQKVQEQSNNRRGSIPQSIHQSDLSGRREPPNYMQQRQSFPRNVDSRDIKNYRNYSGPLANNQKLRSITSMPAQQQIRQDSIRNIQSPIYDQRESIKQTRQEHRRFNPTFLSYGSPSIGLAGRNVMRQ